MIDPLHNARSVLIVFAMPGCHACEEYTPRFHKEIARWQQHGAPFVYFDNRSIQRGQIPVLIIDATSPDPSVVALCEQYNISGMPTTILLSRTAKPALVEGSIDDAELYQMLHSAVLANR